MALSPGDAAELNKYHMIGQYERSPAGATLERAEMFSVKHQRSPEMRAALQARKPWEAPPDALTARPTCEEREVAKSEPNQELMAIYGRVSRKLKAVSMLDNRCAAALTALYGDAGHKWAQGKHGSLGALFGLTDAGDRLREWQRRKSRGARLTLTDDQRIENAVAAAGADATKQEMLGRVMRQAIELKERAEALYTQVGMVRR